VIQALALTLAVLMVIGIGALVAMSLREPKRVFEPMSKRYSSPLIEVEIKKLENETFAKAAELERRAEKSGVHKPPASLAPAGSNGDDHDTRFITSIKQKVAEVQRIEEAL